MRRGIWVNGFYVSTFHRRDSVTLNSAVPLPDGGREIFHSRSRNAGFRCHDISIRYMNQNRLCFPSNNRISLEPMNHEHISEHQVAFIRLFVRSNFHINKRASNCTFVSLELTVVYNKNSINFNGLNKWARNIFTLAVLSLLLFPFCRKSLAGFPLGRKFVSFLDKSGIPFTRN